MFILFSKKIWALSICGPGGPVAGPLAWWMQAANNVRKVLKKLRLQLSQSFKVAFVLLEIFPGKGRKDCIGLCSSGACPHDKKLKVPESLRKSTHIYTYTYHIHISTIKYMRRYLVACHDMNPYGTNSGWGTEVMSCHVVSLRLMLRMIAFPWKTFGIHRSRPSPRSTSDVNSYCYLINIRFVVQDNGDVMGNDNLLHQVARDVPFECFPRPACALFNFNGMCCPSERDFEMTYGDIYWNISKAIYKFDHQYPHTHREGPAESKQGSPIV